MTKEFDGQPTLTGELVTVRPIVPADWDAMFAAAADPEIWAQHPASDRYTERVFRQYFADAIGCGSAFSIVDRQSGVIIGSSRYHGFNPVLREVEIGWTFLACDYWGGAYNSELKRLMMDHAFLYVDTVVFWIGETNLRSRRAAEKIGAVCRAGVHFKDFSGDSPYVIYEVRKST